MNPFGPDPSSQRGHFQVQPVFTAQLAIGSGPQPSHPNTEALRIPDHELVRRIASGAYGEVWLARNAVGTMRAVKIVRRDQHASAESFEREFKGLQKFEPISRTHEGLVDILTLGLLPDGAGFYYVMELADAVAGEREQAGTSENGGQASATLSFFAPAHFPAFSPAFYEARTLRADLKSRGALAAADVIALGLKLTAALAHLHAHGLVHRDIKPSNILFVGGEPKLAGAGLVAAMDDARSLVGTAGYIAPEGPGTPQADLYALGKVLYEAAFGKDRQEFPALPADVASRPDHARLLELNVILLKACATNRRERYASATQMRADLDRVQTGGSVKRREVWRRSLSYAKKLALPIRSSAILFVAVYLQPWKSSAPPVKLSNNSAANEKYRAGLIAMHTSSRESPAQAVRHFERAVQLDPQFAAAHAQLAHAYVLTDSSGRDMLAKAHDAATRAVFLDPQSSDTHSVLATTLMLFELDWSAAEKERQLALKLTSGSEDTLVTSALNLAQMGRWEEAVATMEQALRIDSRSVRRLRHAGNVFLWSRQYDRAIQRFEQLIEVSSPSIRGQLQRVNLANAYRAKGDYLKSIRLEREGALLQGENPEAVNLRCDALETAFRENGAKGFWRARLELEQAKGEKMSLMTVAAAHAELGNADAAFDSLERAFKETPTQFAFFLNIIPSFDRLRADQRWAGLTNRLWRVK